MQNSARRSLDFPSRRQCVRDACVQRRSPPPAIQFCRDPTEEDSYHFVFHDLNTGSEGRRGTTLNARLTHGIGGKSSIFKNADLNSNFGATTAPSMPASHSRAAEGM